MIETVRRFLFISPPEMSRATAGIAADTGRVPAATTPAR